MYEEDLYDDKIREVERQYEQIKGREKVIKVLKFLSVLAVIVSLVALFIYPILNIGGNNVAYSDYISKTQDDGSIESQISSYLETFQNKYNCPDIIFYLGLWYIFTKIIVLAISCIIFLFKNVLFGFFKLITGHKVSYQEKLKVVNKYKKQTNNALSKNIFKSVIVFIISLIIPTLGDILDFKDSASSVIYPIFYAIMIILSYYLPYSLVPVGAVVGGVALSINMLPLTIATFSAVAHALLGIIILITKLVFKSRKIV
ncbi:MAG: hypothetical protein II988_06925 [Clostridia bacterium]|nr:hypothetical protein [Clostridia bacterium]